MSTPRTKAKQSSRSRHPAMHGVRRRHPTGRPLPPHQAGATSVVVTPAGLQEPRPLSSSILLLAVVGALTATGLVTVLSASSVQALRQYGSSWLFFERQLLWLALGTAALLLCMRVDYRRWARLGVPLLVLSAGLLVAVLMPGTGISVSGSSRWLGVGSWRMQPSELAKLAMLIFAAALLARRTGRGPRGNATVGPVLVVFAGLALLIMAQPDMGTTLVMGCMVFVVLYVAGTRLRAIGTLTVAAAGSAFVLAMIEPYRRARLFSFVNPWADPGNTGYQVVQSLVGLGTGGLTGVGVGASRAKWGFLPNAHTDFIFTIIGEELGLMGSLVLVLLFVAFAVLGVRAAVRAPDRFGTLLAAGITAWVVGQALVNMGAVVGLLPVTGVPLPFVSAGGSSLVILMAAIGILLNITGQGRPARTAR